MNDVDKRFVAKFNKVDSGCWEWIGHVRFDGYGEFYYDSKKVRAHRYSYELFKGKIQFGKVIDHLCRNTKCVNPDHLEPVSIYENNIRGFGVAANNLRLNQCKRGHEFNQKNTFYRRTKSGHQHRICRVCHREQMKEWRRLRKGSSPKR